MIFHENCLLADNSCVILCFIFSKIRKDVARFFVCCSRDWRFKGLYGMFTSVFRPSQFMISIKTVDSDTAWKTVQIQIRWLHQKPADLDLQ